MVNTFHLKEKDSLVNQLNKNKMNEITITVSGQSNTGKSRITYLLKQFLSKKGFTVNFDNDVDFETEHDFDKAMKSNIRIAIPGIISRTKIKIKSVQTI